MIGLLHQAQPGSFAQDALDEAAVAASREPAAAHEAPKTR
jgi:hypothetical protein